MAAFHPRTVRSIAQESCHERERTDPGDDTAWQVATTYSHVDVPLAGVGDLARRNADGTALAARKGDMYCNIQVVTSTAGERGDALARKLGALCSKLITSH